MAMTPDEIIARRSTLGASDVPAVLGLSPFSNAADIFLAKMGLSQVQETMAMQLGNWLELPIAQFYAHRENVEIAHFGKFIHKDLTWLSATPDFAVSCPGHRRLLQIKLVGGFMAKHWGPEDMGVDGVPSYVQAQVQTEMEVVDADECDVAALIGSTEFRSYRIVRDRYLMKSILKICHNFWHDCVLTRQHPEIDGSDSAKRMLHAIYCRPNDTSILAPTDAERLGDDLRRVLAAERESKMRRTEIENKIKAVMGDATAIEGETWAATWRPDRLGNRRFKFIPRDSEDGSL